MPMIWLDLKEAGEFGFHQAVKKVRGLGAGGVCGIRFDGEALTWGVARGLGAEPAGRGVAAASLNSAGGGVRVSWETRPSDLVGGAIFFPGSGCGELGRARGVAAGGNPRGACSALDSVCLI